MEKPRIDIPLPDGSVFTQKTMPGGEERRRIRFFAGPSASVTKELDWKPSNGPLPWHDAHFYAGLTKTYVLVSGWVYLLWADPNVKTRCMDEGGQTITFEPGVPHLVLPGPMSVIMTAKYGDPLFNPDHPNKNDWWPVGEDFDIRVKREKAIIDRMVRTKFSPSDK